MSTYIAHVGECIVMQLRSRNRRCALQALRRHFASLGMTLDARFVRISRENSA